jgi:hypothetical protein
MSFITISNSKKLIRKIDEQQFDKIAESIYKRDAYFFSSREDANLKGIRELFKDLENFILVYYKPIEIRDSYRFVFPETQPAYHKDDSCDRLKSSFSNIEVPIEIQEKGPNEVIKFRQWYLSTDFDKDNPKDYIEKVQKEFIYVGPINPRSITYENSGVDEKKDYTLEELEKEIDDILNKCEAYFNDNPNIRNIIYRYQKLTFLGYIDGALKNNNSGLSDEQLKSFLRSYDQTFKRPVKERLVEYYRIKFNPEMQFEGELLEKLGFRHCSHCINH